MKRAFEKESSLKDREVNSMFTSIQNMARNGDERYDAEFVYYCICRLNEKYGQSKRFIMCKLLESGLRSHGLYSENIEEFRREYSFLKKSRSGSEYGKEAVLEGSKI